MIATRHPLEQQPENAYPSLIVANISPSEVMGHGAAYPISTSDHDTLSFNSNSSATRRKAGRLLEKSKAKPWQIPVGCAYLRGKDGRKNERGSLG